MAKNKIKRTMGHVGESQHQTEKNAVDKFAAVEELAQPKIVKSKLQNGRISPQLSCTIDTQDKELLNSLALYLSNKENRILNTSTLIRSLIRLGNKYKDEIQV